MFFLQISQKLNGNYMYKKRYEKRYSKFNLYVLHSKIIEKKYSFI